VSARRSPTDRYIFSGEFHYFACACVLGGAPGPGRRSRLRSGQHLCAVELARAFPGALDLTGRSRPERDLLGALDAIAAAGLTCIYRPGPSSRTSGETAVSGVALERDPSILALKRADQPAGLHRPYPALTYTHPDTRKRPSAGWRRRSCPSRLHGGTRRADRPLQLDDEPSYWQQLDDPLALDYNPHLVDSSRRSRRATPRGCSGATARWTR